MQVKIKSAYRLGRQAFITGKDRVPALDPELIKMLTEPDNLPIIQAWLRGWIEAPIESI